MANLPVYDKETENFSRICCLLICEGTDAMRKFFLSHAGILPTYLHEFLATNKDILIDGMKPNYSLSKDQQKKLFPSKGKADINKLDITLLFILIKHLCNFNLTESQWHDMHGDSDLASIIRLKNIRNNKAHADCCRISQPDFRNEWIRLSKILQKLGVDKKVIDLYAQKDISFTDQQKFIEELRHHGRELKDMIGSVHKELETVSKDVSMVRENNELALKEMNSKHDMLLDGQKEVTSSLNRLTNTLGDVLNQSKGADNPEQYDAVLQGTRHTCRPTPHNQSRSSVMMKISHFRETCPQLNYKTFSKGHATGKVQVNKNNITTLQSDADRLDKDVQEGSNMPLKEKCDLNLSANPGEKNAFRMIKRGLLNVKKSSSVVDSEGKGRSTTDMDSVAQSLSFLVRGQEATYSVVQGLSDQVVNIQEKLENICPSVPQHCIISEDDVLQLCFNAVKQHYLQTRNQIQLLPWDRSDIVSMDTLFTNLSMVVDLLEPNEQLKIPLNSYHDIFRKDTSGGAPVTRVLGYGRAGIGKSTLINKIAYDWARGNKDSPITRFKLVIALSMQKVSPNEDVVEAMFKHGILTEEHIIYRSLLNRFVTQHPHDVAVLLDACDEYKPQSIESQDNGEILKLVENKHLRSSFVVVTSRPWRVDEFKDHRGMYLHCELQGFSKENVKCYVEKFFLRDADRGKALIRYLQNNGLISGIATLPMMTMILCWLWKDNVSMKLPETLSELYDKLLNYMFQRHLDKDKGNTAQLTKYLNKVVKVIGKVGLDGLFNNRTLIFRESDFNESAEMESSTSREVVAIACKIGLLMKDTAPGNVPYTDSEDENTDSDDDNFFSTEKLRNDMKPEVGVLFFHKTAQEKCAALFAAKLARHNPEEFQSYLHRISSVRDALQFEMLLLFLSGTNTKVAKSVLRHLLRIFERELSGDSDRYVTGKLSFEGSMAFQQYIELIIRCNHESKCSGSLNDIIALIFQQRHMRFSNFSPTTANSLGYLLNYSQFQHESNGNVNLNIFKIELMNIRIQTNKEVSTLWEMFPDDEQEFIRKVRKYSLMPKEKLRWKLKECQIEMLPPAFRHFPAYQCLSFMRTFQVTDEHKGDDTDISPILKSLQSVDIKEFTILGFDLATMTDALPNAIRKSTLTVLNLSSANVGPEVCRIVAKSFKETHNLKELIIKNNPIGDGIGFLADNFKYIGKLKMFNVSYSPVSEDGMVTLSLNLHILQELQELSIYQLFDTASEQFAQGIQDMKCLRLLTLPLQGMSTSEAFRIVQRACQFRHLVELKIIDMTESCDLMVSCAADNLIDMPHLKILSLYGKRDEGEIEVIQKECALTNGACDALVRMLLRIGSLERLQIVTLWMPIEGLEEVAMACEMHGNLITFRYSGECLPSGMKIDNFKKIQLY